MSKYKPLPVQSQFKESPKKVKRGARKFFVVMGYILLALLIIAGSGAYAYFTATDERQAEIKAGVLGKIAESALIFNGPEPLIIPFSYNYNGKDIQMVIEAYPKEDGTIDVIVKINNITMDDVTQAIQDAQGIEISGI